MNKGSAPVNFSTFLVAASVLFAASSAASAMDATGRLIAANGGVLIQHGVQTDVARAGSIVGAGDTILTTDTGTTQWQMIDDSVFAIAPSTGFKINRYEMPQGNNAGIASYTLLQGAVHTITGKISGAVAVNDAAAPLARYAAMNARFNPAYLIKVAAAPVAPYVMKTAFATVTPKGKADYAVSQTAQRLVVLVNKGVVTVCSPAGCASPAAGEGVEVNCSACKPLEMPGSSLGMDSLMASLRFDSRDSAFSVGASINNPNNEPAPTPGSGCVAVASQIQADACVPSGPGVPVSPN